MKIGVAGKPQPEDCPAQVVRCSPLDGGDYYWTAVYFAVLKEAGVDGIATFPWQSSGLRTFAKNVDVDWVEYGNEPRPDLWNVYTRRLLKASPILRAQGRKVILAAAQTGHTRKFLGGTPKSVWEAVDAVAIHPYEATPRKVLEHLEMARKFVPAHLPLMVTEVGWSVGDPRLSPKGLIVETEEEQAENLRHTFKLLDEHAEELNLSLACWFTYQDLPDEGNFKGKWWRCCGLTREDGSKRPSYEALEKASRLGPTSDGSQGTTSQGDRGMVDRSGRIEEGAA